MGLNVLKLHSNLQITGDFIKFKPGGDLSHKVQDFESDKFLKLLGKYQ
jgi:hypothetical protein